LPKVVLAVPSTLRVSGSVAGTCGWRARLLVMSKDRAIQLRDMALAIVQLDDVSLPLGRGKVQRSLGDRLTITVNAPTESTNTLTIWNGVE